MYSIENRCAERLILGLVVGAALAIANTASANSLVVTYDLAPGSHFDLTTPIAIANTPVTGSITITFNADNSGNIVDGPITLDSYVAHANFGTGPLSAYGIGGNATSTLVAPASSTLTGSSIALASAVTTLSGLLTCEPTGICATAFSVPPSTPFTFFGPATQGATVGTGNPSTIAATSLTDLTLGTLHVTGTVFFNGTETSRTFVPEPSTLLLVASGIAGLAVRRRRARGASRGERASV